MSALVLVFYFLVVLPQKRRTQFHQKMIADLKVGDKIVTSGGIVGFIEDLEDDIMHIKVDENVVIPIIKRALFNVQTEEVDSDNSKEPQKTTKKIAKKQAAKSIKANESEKK